MVDAESSSGLSDEGDLVDLNPRSLAERELEIFDFLNGGGDLLGTSSSPASCSRWSSGSTCGCTVEVRLRPNGLAGLLREVAGNRRAAA